MLRIPAAHGPACQEQQFPPGARSFLSWSHSLIIPAAQPTPESTVIALTGQLSAQAPHSIQASRSLMVAFFSADEKTWCGQTSMHRPQPMQSDSRNSSVVAPFKYLYPFTCFSFHHRSIETTVKIPLTARAVPITGRATLISLLTPVREV